MGPLSVRTYPGATWQRGDGRATFEPDYGRRGTLWVHGAFEPATGQATILLSSKRDGESHMCLLERMLREFPAQRWLVIEDNLSIHHSKDVKTALLAWPEIQIQFIPKYSSWLNLIEPWWKQLRSLALKGRCFATIEELAASLLAGVDYWNAHKHPYLWKKRPQAQPHILLGGFSSSIIKYSLLT